MTWQRVLCRSLLAVLALITSSVPLSAQCGGCEPGYVGAFDLQDRSIEYCFDSNVPSSVRGAFEAAVADWNDTDVSYAEGACGFEIEMDSSIPTDGMWCYPGSPCNSNSGSGHGVLRGRGTFGFDDMRSMFGHEIGHTTGWDEVSYGCDSIMGYPYGLFGPTYSDLCWYTDLWWGGHGDPPWYLRGLAGSAGSSRRQQQPAGVVSAAQGARTIRPLPPIDYFKPDSFGEMIRAADLVAIVRIRDREYKKIGSQLLTHYQAEIVEVLRTKGEGVARTIDIYQPGGVISTDTGTIDYRDPHFRRLATDGYAIVMLEWNSRYDGYFTAYGADGTFELLLEPGAQSLTGTARTQGRKPDVSRLNGTSISALIAAIRTAAAGGL